MKILTVRKSILLILFVAVVATFIPKTKVLAVGIIVSIQLMCNHSYLKNK